MPFISVTIGQKLGAVEKEKLKAELGRLIAIIPGKSEADLMVQIRDSDTVYMGGTESPAAYIDLRVYTKTTEAAKKTFTQKLFAFIAAEYGIKQERQYLTISEYENWGYDGEFH
jgi:phenylpyruvate tautomerase PptA (4-oxalocrotonate tautomerase family)